MKERRGTALLVFCILSFVYIGFNLFSGLLGFIQGPMSEEQLEETRYAFLSSVEASQAELAEGFFNDIMETTEIFNENFYLMSGVELANLILGLFAVILMFQLKRGGYYLYLVYSLVPIVLYTYLGAGNVIILITTIYFAVVGAIFSILYGFQTKRMD